ncbi:MAG: ribosome-binding factor A [Candidatus Berkelbacteria bacterium]|nr:ribosome-binding factor A [Candidatus Berkelbacteria bacterium]
MTNRINKVNQLLLEELACLIQDDFQGKMVTVSAVDTSLDLKSCKVWFSSCLVDVKQIQKELQKRAYSYQSYLGKKLFIKTIPKITFLIDKSPERVAKIEALLKKSSS